MNDNEILELGNGLLNYCEKYKIPHEYIFSILEDQKVVPMVRGKAIEYSGFLLLSNILNQNEWSVQKLNLNAQPNAYDEDISVTHRRTGIIIKVECKSAVRGSFRSGLGRTRVKLPHLSIKCHRSRSNIKLAGGSNDRYAVDCFDIVIANMSNAVIAGGTYTEDFELIDDIEAIEVLSNFYEVSQDYQSIFDATSDDWRFVVSTDIAVNGFLPRTPTVLLEGDANWKPLHNIEEALNQIIRDRVQNRRDRGHSRR